MASGWIAVIAVIAMVGATVAMVRWATSMNRQRARKMSEQGLGGNTGYGYFYGGGDSGGDGGGWGGGWGDGGGGGGGGGD